MNEEELFNYTDQLILEAREGHGDLISYLEKNKGKEQLIEEIRLLIIEHDNGRDIDWARVFVLAVFGEMYDLNS